MKQSGLDIGCRPDLSVAPTPRLRGRQMLLARTRDQRYESN